MLERFSPERLRGVLRKVEDLLRAVHSAAQLRAEVIASVPAEHRLSATNLAHYLAVRAEDLRPLQRDLADLSLSSLGRMEGHVLDTISGVRLVLLALLGQLPSAVTGAAEELTAEAAEHLLAEHAEKLLGVCQGTRQARIMVTLPASTAGDRELLLSLLRAGTNLVRINLAHDDPAAWTAMVRNLRAAEVECGTRCRILADLPGPKLRTGELEPGPRVVRVQPQRNECGTVIARASVTFLDPGQPVAAASAGIPVPLTAAFAASTCVGDTIVIVDTRGRDRRFAVDRVGAGWCQAATDRTAYLGTGNTVTLHRHGVDVVSACIGELPPRPLHILLQAGDSLVVTRDQAPGRAAGSDAQGNAVPARVPCTLPEVFTSVRQGQRILFDDGKIHGVVQAYSSDELLVHIADVPPGGAKLRAEKGINLPDTDLHTSALTAHDLGCLEWVAKHADLVGISFVQRPADVLRLEAELAARGRSDLGIVLKIETAKAFARLPELLFAGLRSPRLGVMVARGDLAAEVGYGRLAEVQEEILWLCEAAHVPVIWATQVLDSMARTGTPSRAEVTDAAMGVRAECVMLNKGPYITATVRFLGDVLDRMQQHHAKKRSMLRRLRVAGKPAPGSSGSAN